MQTEAENPKTRLTFANDFVVVQEAHTSILGPESVQAMI